MAIFGCDVAGFCVVAVTFGSGLICGSLVGSMIDTVSFPTAWVGESVVVAGSTVVVSV